MNKMMVIVLVFSFGTMLAQEDLMELDFPRIGTNGLYRSSIDYVLPNQDKVTGNDFNWDFKDLTSNQELNSIIWKPFSSATEQQRATYNTSTYYIEDKTGNKPTYFFSNDKNSHKLQGFDFSGQSYIYSKPLDYYIIPMEFGKNYESNFSIKDDVTEGILTTTYDGEGTLSLPNGEYENIHRIRIFTRTVFDDKSDTTYTREYHYIQKETGIILLRLLEGEPTTAPGQSFYSYEYYDSPATSVNEALSNLTNLYPNPASNNLIIVVPNSIVTNYEIVDLNGTNLLSSKYTNYIDISSLNSGIYFVKATLINQEIVMKKFVKQ